MQGMQGFKINNAKEGEALSTAFMVDVVLDLNSSRRAS